MKKLYKKNIKVDKIFPEKNKIEFDFIKSNLNQKTISLKKRQNINLLKLKKYSKNLNYFLEQNKFGEKIEKEINKFKGSHYISSNSLEVMKNFEKDEIKFKNDIGLFGSVNIKDFYKEKKGDSFSIAEFSRKINQLNENVAYKYKKIIEDNIKSKFSDIYKYKEILESKLKKSIS